MAFGSRHLSGRVVTGSKIVEEKLEEWCGQAMGAGCFRGGSSKPLSAGGKVRFPPEGSNHRLVLEWHQPPKWIASLQPRNVPLSAYFLRWARIVEEISGPPSLGPCVHQARNTFPATVVESKD